MDDPPVGFFVAGSSIDDLNGIYVRTNRYVLPRHHVAMAYAHQEGGWTLALCATGGDEDSSDEDDTYEWRFIDANRVDRFTHEGDTLIPGAGVRWSHASHGAVGDGHVPDATSLVAGKSEEELEDELPWQLIALLDAAITRDLLRSHAWREHKVERAPRRWATTSRSPRTTRTRRSTPTTSTRSPRSARRSNGSTGRKGTSSCRSGTPSFRKGNFGRGERAQRLARSSRLVRPVVRFVFFSCNTYINLARTSSFFRFATCPATS